jgi:hypothetical protein
LAIPSGVPLQPIIDTFIGFCGPKQNYAIHICGEDKCNSEGVKKVANANANANANDINFVDVRVIA